jgi:coenzyme F420 hydrogenase subunit beta
MLKKDLHRVALVGTPCQIKAVRRMQVLGIIPADSIKFCLGLFCSGNFTFGEKQRQSLSKAFEFSWDNVKKVNIKENLMIHLDNNDIKHIELENLDFMRRYACQFCPDYSSEFADISFGGIGAEEGWTTVITRTPLGRAVMADAKSVGSIEELSSEEKPKFASEALEKVQIWSTRKRKSSRQNRRKIMGRGVMIKE